ncbi:serine/threonine-protein kinase [Streptomyces sp. NPDC012888]|uniref:serine/threonine-protein kinase n=1 Tax=Streptomyces sp. NPDC012888 TaxID=3364855 RepID=UPI0036CF9A48
MNAWTVPGYRETRELGSGGSGRVVLAVHEATGTPVAVKYLSARFLADPAFLSEFRAEARLLGGLRSPYVVGFYEYVEAPGGAAIVMELVDGVALRALLGPDGRTEPEAALALLKGSLLGLAAAHRAGVVHRDYKPENVLVAADGSSKLVDFGIAAGRGSTPGVAGTPAYMAPEQWQGGPASPAADVYAATAVFFECLTGRKPYTGQNFAELALQHVEAPVPDAEAPEPVRPLLRRGLAKRPEQRPEDAEAFVAELEALARGAYGDDWEERGQRKLAALAALLPLLFPAAAEPAVGTTALADTSLGSGWAPGRSGLFAAGVALVVGALLVLATQASGNEPGGGAAVSAFATTGTGGGASRPAPGPTASRPPTASPSATPSASPSPSASAQASPSWSPSWSPSPSPSPSVTGWASPSPTPTRVTPTVTPPPTTTAPPSPTVRVYAVGARLSRGEAALRVQAAVSVKASGTGPVKVTVQWFTGDGTDPTVPDGTDTLTYQGAELPPVSHPVSRSTCSVAVRVTTTPAAENGPAGDTFVLPRCVPS